MRFMISLLGGGEGFISFLVDILVWFEIIMGMVIGFLVFGRGFVIDLLYSIGFSLRFIFSILGNVSVVFFFGLVAGISLVLRFIIYMLERVE